MTRTAVHLAPGKVEPPCLLPGVGSASQVPLARSKRPRSLPSGMAMGLITHCNGVLAAGRNAMKRQIRAIGFTFGLVFALAGGASAAELKMMTGPQGGSWIPL